MRSIAYTKWPRLLVAGENVTPEQAEEMILRTAHWSMLSCNDTQFLRDLHRVAGLPPEPGFESPVSERMDWYDVTQDFGNHFGGAVHLNYLDLTDRIVSSWVGGSHGWVDWDGTVGSSNYNIGKWPTQEEIEEELTALGEAFPWLNVTFQLLTEEGEGEIADTWALQGGSWIRMDEEDQPFRVAEPTDPDWGIWDQILQGDYYRHEQGITIERFEQIVARHKVVG